MGPPSYPPLLCIPRDRFPRTQVCQVVNKDTSLSVTLTMREVIKWIRRKLAASAAGDDAGTSSPGAQWVRAGLAILAPSLRYPVQQVTIASLLREVLDPHGPATLPPAPLCLVQRSTGVELIDKSDRTVVAFRGAQLDLMPSLRGRDVCKLPQKFLLLLLRVAKAVSASEPVLLVGPTSCKSMVVRVFCELTSAAFGGTGSAAAAYAPTPGEDLVEVHLTSDTESQDLIGGIKPVSPRDAALRYFFCPPT